MACSACGWLLYLVKCRLELSDVDFTLRFCLEAFCGEAEEDCSVCQPLTGDLFPIGARAYFCGFVVAIVE